MLAPSLWDGLRDVLAQPWRVAALAVGGLLAAIIVAGLLGFLLNRHIAGAADEALRYDVEVEDRGHDLELAVLDVRHQHRNIAFLGPSSGDAEDLERAYGRLERAIDAYEDLGVREPGMVRPDEFRRMAARYYGEFRPAVDLARTDRAAFEEASDRGLERLGRLNEAAEGVGESGEELAARSLNQVDTAATTSTFVLLAAVLGLLLVGAMLAYAAVRVVRQLRDLSAAQNEFLADVSHELRTPLTVVRGNAEVGLAVGDLGCRHGKMLEKIVRESGRMSRMVDDLLFLARSDSASPPLREEEIGAAPFLAEVASSAESLAREHGSRLTAELPATGRLKVDPARIEQAVLALVDNAAKYGPPGGEVRLASSNEPGDRAGRLRVEVSDDGPGIPEEDLERVFERFYRPDKARSRALGGSGLGLSIAKTIVEAHGGSVRADRRPDGGASVSILLPLTAETSRARPRSPGLPRPGS